MSSRHHFWKLVLTNNNGDIVALTTSIVEQVIGLSMPNPVKVSED